jgi:hypothetical protein
MMGVGLPFFFVPVTALALGCVEERELASAAGLQNFLRTLSGAVAISIVTTAWEDKTSFVHAEFAGFVDRSGDLSISLGNMGMSVDAVRSTLDHLLQGQSVMVATNQLMAAVAIILRHIGIHDLARAEADARNRFDEGGALTRHCPHLMTEQSIPPALFSLSSDSCVPRSEALSWASVKHTECGKCVPVRTSDRQYRSCPF